MSYAVRWQPRARRQLADAYLTARAAGHGRSVTQASAQIDALLADDPGQAGESRGGRNRVLFVWPLVVHYQIVPRRRQVIVQAARYLGPRTP
jgi:hypothetical protein